MFVGITPRMAEKVPATCMYWLTVEGVRRVLMPYTLDQEVQEV